MTKGIQVSSIPDNTDHPKFNCNAANGAPRPTFGVLVAFSLNCTQVRKLQLFIFRLNIVSNKER